MINLSLNSFIFFSDLHEPFLNLAKKSKNAPIVISAVSARDVLNKAGFGEKS